MIGRVYWDVRDYIDHHGKNVVRIGVLAVPVAAKMAINEAVRALRVSRPPLGRPLVGKLKNKDGESGEGLLELRVPFDGVQYRPIMCYGPNGDNRQITLLGLAIEKNGRFTEKGICDACQRRKSRLGNNEHFTVPHDFS